MPRGDTPQKERRAGPVLARQRLLRVEAVGRTDQFGEAPYQELYWYEGRRGALPWPSTLWCFDAAGAVATPADEGPHAQEAAAAAVDAVRQALALRLPEDLGKSRRGPEDRVDVEAALKEALARANAALRNRALASRDHKSKAGCSLLVGAVRSNRAVAMWIGDCACYLMHQGECSELTDQSEPAQDADTPRFPMEDSRRSDTAPHASEFLGRIDEISPSVCTHDVRPGDVLVLASRDIREHVHGPEEIARFITESGALAQACERLLVEARLRGARGTNSVVMLGVALERAEMTLEDPERNPLAFVLALRAVALPAGSEGEDANLDGIDALLRRIPALTERADGSDGGVSAGATPEPQPAALTPPDVATSEPASNTEHISGRGSETVSLQPPSNREPAGASSVAQQASRPARTNWLLVFLLLVVTAGAVGVLFWQQRNAKSVQATQSPSLLARGSTASHPANGPASPMTLVFEGYSLEFEPRGESLEVSMNDEAPGAVEVILQEVHGERIDELFRESLQPGRSLSVAMPEASFDTAFFRESGFLLRFSLTGEGQIEWAPSARLADLPAEATVSTAEARVYVTDRRAPIVLVVKVLTSERSSVGGALPPWPRMLWRF